MFIKCFESPPFTIPYYDTPNFMLIALWALCMCPFGYPWSKFIMENYTQILPPKPWECDTFFLDFSNPSRLIITQKKSKRSGKKSHPESTSRVDCVGGFPTTNPKVITRLYFNTPPLMRLGQDHPRWTLAAHVRYQGLTQVPATPSSWEMVGWTPITLDLCAAEMRSRNPCFGCISLIWPAIWHLSSWGYASLTPKSGCKSWTDSKRKDENILENKDSPFGV